MWHIVEVVQFVQPELRGGLCVGIKRNGFGNTGGRVAREHHGAEQMISVLVEGR